MIFQNLSYGYGLMDTLSMVREYENVQDGGGIRKTENEQVVSRKKFVLSSKYFKLAQKKNLGQGKCYNCFETNHNCFSCTHKYCKFCKCETEGSGHFSLACKKCPSKL